MLMPERSLQGRLAGRVHAGITQAWGVVSDPRAESRRWEAAFAAANLLIDAGFTDDKPDAPTRQGRGFRPGDRIHGFAGGAFGRDSYACRTVEAVGSDWIVTRNDDGAAEAVTGERAKGLTREDAGDRSWCSEDCT